MYVHGFLGPENRCTYTVFFYKNFPPYTVLNKLGTKWKSCLMVMLLGQTFRCPAPPSLRCFKLRVPKAIAIWPHLVSFEFAILWVGNYVPFAGLFDARIEMRRRGGARAVSNSPTCFSTKIWWF